MRHIILSSVAWTYLQYLSTLSHKRYDFREKLLNITCKFWFSLQLLSDTFLNLGRIQRDIMCTCLHVKYSLFLSDFRSWPKSLTWRYYSWVPSQSEISHQHLFDFLNSVDRASWYIRTIRTDMMHYCLLIYFSNKPLHVSSRLAAHHE